MTELSHQETLALIATALERRRRERDAREATLKRRQSHWRTRLAEWLRGVADDVELAPSGVTGAEAEAYAPARM